MGFVRDCALLAKVALKLQAQIPADESEILHARNTHRTHSLWVGPHCWWYIRLSADCGLLDDPVGPHRPLTGLAGHPPFSPGLDRAHHAPLAAISGKARSKVSIIEAPPPILAWQAYGRLVGHAGPETDGGPLGGVVTQRTANPCTPVRFRQRPPAFRLTTGLTRPFATMRVNPAIADSS